MIKMVTWTYVEVTVPPSEIVGKQLVTLMENIGIDDFKLNALKRRIKDSIRSGYWWELAHYTFIKEHSFCSTKEKYSILNESIKIWQKACNEVNPELLELTKVSNHYEP